MKIRLLTGFGGMVEGHYNLKRGDIIDIPESNAKHMIVNCYATAKLKGDLPPAHEVTTESKALADWARQEALRQIPEGVRPLPVVAVGGRYSRGKREGWIP